MGVELLTERYKDQISGVLSCYDRIIIQGTLPQWCYAKGMTDYCYAHQIRIFDYAKFVQPLRDSIQWCQRDEHPDLRNASPPNRELRSSSFEARRASVSKTASKRS